MTKQTKSLSEIEILRQRAEELLSEQKSNLRTHTSEQDILKLNHEL
jgi:hypothetical protein